MCGRFVLAVDPEVIQQAFNLESSVIDFSPRYNIAPTQMVPVISNEQPKYLSLYRWGLIPAWSKDERMGSKLINARADSVAQKPSFRGAFRRRRCLVPATGFYEWQQHDKGTKTPMYVHLKDQELFAMAGLWEVWHNPRGDAYHTFTIITTDANDFMKSIHNRMPVILHPADYDLWLQAEEVPADVLQGLLKPFEADTMIAHEVSKAVNRPAVDEPQLIEPVA